MKSKHLKVRIFIKVKPIRKVMEEIEEECLDYHCFAEMDKKMEDRTIGAILSQAGLRLGRLSI
jgi:hypothetical protein